MSLCLLPSRPVAFYCALCASLWLCLFASLSRAEPAGPAETRVRAIPNDVKVEASWRFDRGLSLYNQGDYEGALVEFERAYALTRHEPVLFNIGLVQAKLGDSVACLSSLEPLVKSRPEALGPERLKRARQILKQHRPNVGSLEVATNVAEAVIQVNGVEASVNASGAIAVSAGKHVVSVFAPGHEPRRVAVTVAGRAKRKVEILLLPTQQTLAHLTVTTSTPDVQIFAGRELIGATPFTSTLSFKPGAHQLRFRRLGYREEQRRVVLHPGSSGLLDVKMTPKRDPASTGRLVIHTDESNAVVWVDGEPRLDFSRGMSLPLGRHQIRVQRSGYYDLERDVVVSRATSQLNIELFPTSATLTAYERNARATRTWSWLSLGSGAFVASGSVAFLIWNQGEKRDAERAFDAQREVAASSASGSCGTDSCEERLVRLGDELSDKRSRDAWGWAGVSIGAVGLAAGVALRLWGDDPDAFQPEDEKRFSSDVTVSASPNGLVLNGTF